MTLPRRALVATILAGAVAPAYAEAVPDRVRGTIVRLEDNILTVTARGGGMLKVVLKQDAAVIAVVPATLGEIKPGSFIGTAALPGPHGTLIALEVHIFPEAMRGVGEGHGPFDLQPESTMTNGTVGDVAAADGRTIRVVYKGGEKTITVPPDIPVVGFEPADRRMLVPGAHAILFGMRQPDGTLDAARVLVGRNGLVPPM